MIRYGNVYLMKNKSDTFEIFKEYKAEVEKQTEKVIHRSSKIHHESGRNYGFLLTQDGDVILKDDDKPLTYQDAMNSLDSERWLKAMKSEMESMYQSKVLTLVDPLEGVKPIRKNQHIRVARQPKFNQLIHGLESLISRRVTMRMIVDTNEIGRRKGDDLFVEYTLSLTRLFAVTNLS
ncbi:hypothetical protein AgCh_031572 [Apium graveolens]